jgi:hypothetical protein
LAEAKPPFSRRLSLLTHSLSVCMPSRILVALSSPV